MVAGGGREQCVGTATGSRCLQGRCVQELQELDQLEEYDIGLKPTAVHGWLNTLWCSPVHVKKVFGAVCMHVVLFM